MWIQEERDAISKALGSKQDQIVRLEVFLRIFDRELQKKGINVVERKAIHEALIEAGSQVAVGQTVG